MKLFAQITSDSSARNIQATQIAVNHERLIPGDSTEPRHEAFNVNGRRFVSITQITTKDQGDGTFTLEHETIWGERKPTVPGHRFEYGYTDYRDLTSDPEFREYVQLRTQFMNNKNGEPV